MKKTLRILVVLAVAAYGCGSSDGSGGSGGSAGSGGSGGSGGSVSIDLCQTDPIGTCSGECAFEPPSGIDCASACQNIADVCASGCAGQCEGITLDPTLCAAACEGTKDKRCTNLVFGCYDQNNTCDGVGNCVVNGGL